MHVTYLTEEAKLYMCKEKNPYKQRKKFIRWQNCAFFPLLVSVTFGIILHVLCILNKNYDSPVKRIIRINHCVK